MTQRGSWAHGALMLLVMLAGPSASSQPPRPAGPPTYDCEPGRPDPVTKSCRCPDDYEPHVHENKIPYCRKLPKRTRAPRSLPAAEPSGLACGELAPRVGVSCTRDCGDVQRDAVPSPWNTGAVSWIPLNDRVPPTTRACSRGPTANARVDASCVLEAGHLSVGITASVGRDGDCGACAESSSVAAFDWRTRVPRRSRAALFIQGWQTNGTAATKRCTLQVGAENRSWSNVEAGIVRGLDERDLDIHLTCMDPSAGLVSAGCYGIDELIALAIRPQRSRSPSAEECVRLAGSVRPIDLHDANPIGLYRRCRSPTWGERLRSRYRATRPASGPRRRANERWDHGRPRINACEAGPGPGHREASGSDGEPFERDRETST